MTAPATSTTPSPATPTPAAPPQFSQRELWVILGSLMLATVLSALDTSIVSTAMPTIVGKLGGFNRFAWVGTSYILTSTIATPILGKLGDLFGRRRMILVTIGIFTLGSLLCGLSQTMNQLIASRAVQGIGGGGIQALTFGILGDLVSPRDRGRYMGLYTGIFAAAAVIGPLLGGWMIAHFHWSWIFLVNLPVAAIAVIAIMKTLRITHVRRSSRIDLLGAALLTVFLGSVVVALEQGRRGWLRTPVAVLSVAAAVAVLAFVWQERRADEPIVPLHLFRNKVFRVGAGLGAIAGAMSFGVTTFLPLQFQDANFVSPQRAGLYLAPIMVGIMVGSAYGGRLIAKTGRYRFVPVTCLALSVMGTFAISRLTTGTPYWMLVLPMTFIGMGNGASFTTSSIATQNAIDPKVLGIGTATLVSLRSLGGSLALAIYGAIFTTKVTDGLRHLPGVGDGDVSRLVRDPKTIKALDPVVRDTVAHAITNGTRMIFLVATPMVFCGFLLAVILPELPLRTTPGGGSPAPSME